MMKTILCIALVAVVASAAMSRTNFESNLEDYDYDTYLRDFGKETNTNSASYLSKKALFHQRVAEIIAHNSDPTQTWKMGVNKFTDMSDAERRAFLGYKKGAKPQSMLSNFQLPSVDISALPTSVDWRNKGVVTPVKDQGGCGSCWAFAATEVIESITAIQTGKLVELSPQNMVSCTPNPRHCGGSGGCGGATCELGFNYVYAAGGIASERDYPYKAADTPCDEKIKKTVAIDGFYALPANNYTALLTALATYGPVAVSVDAGPMFAYSSGIFTGCKFDRNIDINHAIVAVGYGSENGQDYWIVRNSWGNWGENGYIRIFKHSDGDKNKWCGKDETPEHGTACEGEKGPITVCGSCGIWFDNAISLGGRILQ